VLTPTRLSLLFVLLLFGCQATPNKRAPSGGGISICKELLNTDLKTKVAAVNLERFSSDYRERLFRSEESSRTGDQRGALGFKYGEFEIDLSGSNETVSTLKKRFTADRRYVVSWDEFQGLLIDRAESAQFDAFVKCLKGYGLTVTCQQVQADLIEIDVQWVQPRGARIDPPNLTGIVVSPGSSLTPGHPLVIGQPLPDGISKLMVSRDRNSATLVQVHTSAESDSCFIEPNIVEPPDPPSKEVRKTIEMKDGMFAKHVAGRDGEVHSDDCTLATLSYWLRREGQTILADLELEIQESHPDCSLQDTVVLLRREDIELFTNDDPRLVIKSFAFEDVMAKTETDEVKGSVTRWIAFKAGSLGVLKEVTMRVDGPSDRGDGDLKDVGLEGTFKFTVEFDWR
jgi:hypothetical protein